MKTFLMNRRGQLILRVIVGGIFIYAGVLKALAPQEFADNIAAYQLLPAAFINLLALSLPVFEIITGLMLITGFQLRIAAFSALVLSMVFGVALASVLARGLKIDCGCFGSGVPSTLKTWFSLGRDVLLGGVAAIILWQAVSKYAPDIQKEDVR